MSDRMATPTRRSRRSAAWFWLVLIAWIAFLVLILGATAGLAQIYRGDRILAGVNALGRDLSALTPAEAAEMLRAEWSTRTVSLEADEQRWTLSPEQVGVVLEADQIAHVAQMQGRRGALDLESLWPLVRRLVASTGLIPIDVDAITVPPAWRFDRDAAAETLRTLAAQLEIIPQDASVGVVNGAVQTTPPITGRAVDIAAMLTTLERHPWETSLARPPADVPLRFTLPVVSRTPMITDVSGIVSEVAPLLATPITLQLYDPIRDERTTWTASPAEMGGWLSFQVTGADAQKTISWQVDEAKVSEFIAAQNRTFGDERYVDPSVATSALTEAFKTRRPEVSLRVSHGEREHIVKSGETLSSIAFDYGLPYPWLLKVNPGIGDNLFVGDKIKIASVDGLLPLPVVENKRIKISLKDQRVQAYENGQLKWDWIASTGIASSPTSPGVFQIQTHEPMAYAGRWDLYMPWFMGIYRPVPDQDFMNGFHGFPSRDQKQILWTRNLGHPITYGCILLDTKNVKLLYDWAEAGVVVEITP